MSAGRNNIVQDWGTTLSYTFLYEIDDVAVNLTGYRARLQIRSAWLPDGEVYATFGTTSPDSGLTIPTPTNGTIVWGPVDRTTLDDVPPNTTCVWDLFIYQASGVEYRILYGTFFLRPIATEVP